MRIARRYLEITLIVCLTAASGCVRDPHTGEWVPAEHAGPKTGDPGMESNIIGVSKFFPASPWLVFDADGSGRVDGVKFNVFLEGPHGPKGVFGNGDIVVDMYRIDSAPDGSEVASHIHRWDLDSSEAYPWRCKKETSMGWGYGLRLQWPATLDVQGRQVAFLVRYRRDDGKLLNSSRQILRVPARGKKPIRFSDPPPRTGGTKMKEIDVNR